jgi:IS5 family transposase
MTRVVPWADLVAVIEPVYPKSDGPGRPPVGIERMLRLHCLQQRFNLSDPAVEEALYDSRAMRQFVGIDLGREPVSDETTISDILLDDRQGRTRVFLDFVDTNQQRITMVKHMSSIHDKRSVPFLFVMSGSCVVTNLCLSFLEPAS